MTIDVEQLHLDRIKYHMLWARTTRKLLDRLPDGQHERRRATVRELQHQVRAARAHNHQLLISRRQYK
jgi:hypothetical protein